MNKKGFINNFFAPELVAIITKSKGNILILLIILFISLLSIGVGNGALIEINKKMNNPFIKFMDITIPRLSKDMWPEYQKKLINDMNKFGYSEPTPFRQDNHEFLNPNKDNLSKMFKVMCVDENNPFLEELIKNSNNRVLSSKFNFQDDDWGCVITKDVIDELKLNNDINKISHIFWNNDPTSELNTSIPIPVSGVVTDLRDGYHILVSKKLFYSLRNREYFYCDADTTYLTFCVKSNLSFQQHPHLKIFKQLGLELLNRNDAAKIQTHTDHFYINTSNITNSEFNNINNKLSEIKSLELIRFFDLESKFEKFNLQKKIDQSLTDADVWTIMFKDLELIEGFADNVKNNYKKESEIVSPIEIDRTIIETKKNFQFFKILVLILSWSLAVFSAISIIFFILNLMLSHIKNNKRNLGTLKAFGFSNKNIIITYSMITICLVFGAFLFSYILSEICGKPLLNVIAYLSKNPIISSLEYSNYSFPVLVSFLVALPGLFITYRVYKFLNKVTPGDLIYERK
tara:strand:+ start:1069 stop:2616 length:1548 start_codon:yes stop_codon:yes gene_type:complete